MRVARIRTTDGAQIAVDQGDGWRRLKSVDSTDGPAVVRAMSDRAAVELGEPFESAIGTARFAPPIGRPGKIIAVGLNYGDHIRETGATPPERPILFAKFPSAMTGPYDEVVVDPGLTEQGDSEVELGVVIGTESRRVPAAQALDHVFGYLVANDVSARDWQKLDGQLSRSKSMDTFLPIGPWVTTADEVTDPNDLAIRSTVNGEQRQDSTTAEMIFTVAELIEFCSRTMTLEPGDIILTGTPHGVGYAMDPPRFLASGDVVRCEIEGLGYIENTVR